MPGPRLLTGAPWRRLRPICMRAPARMTLPLVPLIDCLMVVVFFLLHSFEPPAEG